MCKNYLYQCNNCYSCKNKEEGCFTNDPDKFKENKEGSCLDGTWDEDSVRPNFKPINEHLIRFENIFQNVMDTKEIRPFNEKEEKDGNWHYIHQVNVSDGMVKVRELLVELLNTKPSIDWCTLFCDAGDPYLSEPLTSDVYNQGEEAILKHIEDNKWEAVENETAETIFDMIDGGATTMKYTLESCGIEVKGLANA